MHTVIYFMVVYGVYTDCVFYGLWCIFYVRNIAFSVQSVYIHARYSAVYVYIKKINGEIRVLTLKIINFDVKTRASLVQLLAYAKYEK